MLRYLLSKLQAMSSDVRSPRLLDMEEAGDAGGGAAIEALLAVAVEDCCFRPSM